VPELRAHEGAELFRRQRGIREVDHQVRRYQQPENAKHDYNDQVGKIIDVIRRPSAIIEFCYLLKVVRVQGLHSAILFGYCRRSHTYLMKGILSVTDVTVMTEAREFHWFLAVKIGPGLGQKRKWLCTNLQRLRHHSARMSSATMALNFD
jgi:hypothetical protein